MGGGPVWSGWGNVQGHFGFCRAPTVYNSIGQPNASSMLFTLKVFLNRLRTKDEACRLPLDCFNLGNVFLWVCMGPRQTRILQQWADEDFISFFLNVGGNVCVCVCKSGFVRVMVRERDRQTETNRQRQRERQRAREMGGGGESGRTCQERTRIGDGVSVKGLKKGNWRGVGWGGGGVLILMWCNYCCYYPVYKFVSWHNNVFYILGKF